MWQHDFILGPPQPFFCAYMDFIKPREASTEHQASVAPCTTLIKAHTAWGWGVCVCGGK